MSKIEWTEKTWNPFSGCSVTSAGCKNCYAMRMAGRLQKMNPDSHYRGTTEVVKGKVVWTGKIAGAPDAKWTEPLRRRKPTVYFVNSMGDMFHPNVSDALIDRAFAVMALASHHTFQILTKYPERMQRYFRSGWGFRVIEYIREFKATPPNKFETIQTVNGSLPNVWLGVSVESADHKDRIDVLRNTPAAIRFISFEPLLGPIGPVDFTDIEWAIIGGESGKGSRPMHPDWATSLRDQCLETRTLFFFKQWGDWISYIDRDRDDPDWRQKYAESQTFQILNLAGGRGFHGERVHQVQRVGKRLAGRTLDGQIWNERPPLMSETAEAG